MQLFCCHIGTLRGPSTLSPTPVPYRGKTVYVQFSRHKELKRQGVSVEHC